MSSLGELLLRAYAFLIRIPVLGYLIRLPLRVLRAILRPVVIPIIHEVTSALQADTTDGLQSRIQGIEQRLDASSAGPQGPVLAALFDTTAGLQSQIQALWQRLDFVRAEAMFEMRTLATSGNREVGYESREEAKIKDRAKLDAALANQTLRLNVGCGHIPLEGYLNVDGRDLPGVDLVSDVAAIPLDAGSVAEIFSSHLLEHFPLEHLKRVVLPHWQGLLRPGGLFRAIVPDAEGMIGDYVAKHMSFDDLREVTFGLQEYEGDFHFNMFSRDGLTKLVEDAGFENVRYEFTNRMNGKCRDMEIRGIKP